MTRARTTLGRELGSGLGNVIGYLVDMTIAALDRKE